MSSIRDACRVMGFTAPPVCKKELKKRFIELTKRHHPDRGGAESSNQKMMQVTESYKLLRSLLEKKVHVSGSPSSSTNHHSVDDIRASSASFHAPGFNLSSQGMWLPWQKEPTTHQKAADKRSLTDPLAGGSFATFATEARRVAQQEASAHEAAAKSSSGSHGFDGEHFSRQRQMRREAESPLGPSSAPTTSLIALAIRYYSARIRQAPQTFFLSLRFIFTGR